MIKDSLMSLSLVLAVRMKSFYVHVRVPLGKSQFYLIDQPQVIQLHTSTMSFSLKNVDTTGIGISGDRNTMVFKCNV